MSSTQYQIFCRYYHSSAGKIVTNESEVTWKQAEDAHSHDENGKQVAPSVNTVSVKGKENMIIRNEDYLRVTSSNNESSRGYPMTQEYNQRLKNAKAIDTALSNLIAEETENSNPKYDMIFLYDGINICEGAEVVNTEKFVLPSLTSVTTTEKTIVSRTSPIVYYERMRRLDGPAPWFLYASASSLKAILKKAEELINIMGSDNVIIGKVVEISEYLDIV